MAVCGTFVTRLTTTRSRYWQITSKGRWPFRNSSRPKKFEFIVNLNAAKQIGLMIPPNVLARADQVIK
jgi:hypothetical protein